ncbi:hypothetical protein [Streptacidiphilus cavernicola]|uniref:Uncharacterized protein n=1 Tax=Streptacidiphilus cavernicola TaxID=3342716 RepID=A0ABV6W5M2_9ACTN
MPLSTHQRDLLSLVAKSTTPVAMSGFFETINPPAPGLNEDHPDHPAWTERQLALYGVSLELWRQGLVRVVTPADGSNPDLVEATSAGLAALAH